ncbi:MAG: hypothetical protein COB49_06870 [Alphaproteobacteria bacterium]|nr:MAG: hypothetical protein COB49_06870 [Alphaproteobacteria bacterium]
MLVIKLYQQYELNIRKYLMRKVRQKEDVEDIVQETFLKAHRVSDWEDVRNPESYLVSIAKNAYRDHIRKETHNIVDYRTDITCLQMKDDRPGPEQIISGKQDFRELEKVIKSLTPRVKQAIILIKIMNVTYAEASEIMGVSISTLENHVTKGIAECRRKIKTQTEYSGLRSYESTVISLSDHKVPDNKKRNSNI